MHKNFKFQALFSNKDLHPRIQAKANSAIKFCQKVWLTYDQNLNKGNAK